MRFVSQRESRNPGETLETLKTSQTWRARVRSRAFYSALPWAGLLVSALFAYLAVRNVRFGDVWQALRSSNYWWLVPAFAMLAMTVYIRALRWRFLFAPETRPATRAVLRALLIGYFFNSILPARAGEAARVLALKPREGSSRAETAATVVVERVYDVLILLLLLFVTVPWLPRVTWLSGAIVLEVALAAAIAIAIVLLAVYETRPVHAALRPLAWLPFLSAERVRHLGENLGHGLAALRQPKLVLAAVFWTTLSWLALGLSTWFVLIGFHLGLSPVAGLLVVITTNLAMVLPSSPSAVGVYEAATLVALRTYQISDSRGLSCALVIHALNFLPYIAAGLFLLRGTLRTGGAHTERESGLLTAKSSMRRSG
jgi:glycosyltransferase 2 family protein